MTFFITLYCFKSSIIPFHNATLSPFIPTVLINLRIFHNQDIRLDLINFGKLTYNFRGFFSLLIFAKIFTKYLILTQNRNCTAFFKHLYLSLQYEIKMINFLNLSINYGSYRKDFLLKI